MNPENTDPQLPPDPNVYTPRTVFTPNSQPADPFTPAKPEEPLSYAPLNIGPQQGGSRFGRIFKSKLAFLIIITLIVIGASAGAYFGYYLPNKPENIWNTALSRTAKGYDKLAEYISKERDTKGVAIKGSFKFGGDFAADGSFEGKSNDDNGEFSGSISATGLKVNLDVKTIKSPGNSPDIYFRLNGLEGLGDLLGGGDPTVTSALNTLNNQWYFIDHTLFDQFAPGSNTSTQITSEDVSSIITAVGNATKEFIFTSDPKKAVFVVKQNVGKEKQDGRGVYHYKVSFKKENLANFVDGLCSDLAASKLNKFFNGDQASVEDVLDCHGLRVAADNVNDAKEADVWVDLKTKLISKIRFNFSSGQRQTTDVEVQPGQDDFSSGPESSGYIEISQNYTGGDIFPFKIYYQEEEKYVYSSTDTVTTTTSGSLNVSLDMKSDRLELTGDYQTKSQDYNSTAKFNLEISPSPDEVKVEKPAKAKNLIQLLNDLGFGELLSGGLVAPASQARDTERKTDIKGLQGQLEAYWADKGYYTTLAEVNNPSWFSQNFKGLDPEALKDPQGTSQKLASSSKAKAYSYVVSPAGCNNIDSYCDYFTLTATLESGGTFSVQSYSDAQPLN